MLAKIYSGATIGLTATLIDVEVDVASSGLPSVTIVGLASKAVEEAKERVRAALQNSSIEFPARRITINLAPADLPKEGPAYDLPIALGLIIASGQISPSIPSSLFLGELSLDGSLRHTKGALVLTELAKQHQFKNIFLPSSNAHEAAIVGGINIFPVNSIKQLLHHFLGNRTITPAQPIKFSSLQSSVEAEFDFSEIKGQAHAKRALEIAAAGGHNIFLYGTPGAGKTMMARALPGILPPLTKAESIEVTKIYSVAGLLDPDQSLILTRPYRSPHHTTSRVGLIGGGSKPQPGEISLAHRGVLFLDEFPEFPRHVIESLRQPLEDGIVSITRAAGSLRFPAQFMLVAAANPCPCGHLGSKKHACRCLPGAIHRYQQKISGPILDRIDLHLHVPEVSLPELAKTSAPCESSASIRTRVIRAREIQKHRYRHTRLHYNQELTPKLTQHYCQLNQQSSQFLLTAATKLKLSARSYQKILKISRTIADLANTAAISTQHLAEALQYRPRSRD